MNYEVLPQRSETLPPATHTNCYLLDKHFIVDPGSPFEDENRKLLAQVGREVRAVILTHRHRDHVSGAAFVASALGCEIWAHRVTKEELQGKVVVDRTIVDGEEIPGGAVVLHTPGHARGHVCLWEPHERWLVCGDMVAGVGSILIAPPDGDVTDYLDSLRRLQTLEPAALLPAHGPIVTDAQGKLDEYIDHRLAREQQVLAALSDDWQTPEEIVPHAYKDTPSVMYPLAAQAALAHLLKLVKEGRARENQGRFRTSSLLPNLDSRRV